MGMMNKLLNFLGLSGDEEVDNRQNRKYDMQYEEDEWLHEENEYYSKPKGAKSVNQGSNVVSLQSVKQQIRMILMEPRTYEETQEMADHLRNRRPIILNLQRLHHDQAKRVVDFLSGTVYAIGGDIQKLGTNIFLCTPDNVEVQGSISEFIQEDYHSKMR